MVITRTNAVHALLYLIVSLLAVAVIFFALGAPFVAALEVIIYAGAIMVLFVFVVMMLNLRRARREREERPAAAGRRGLGPAVLALVLLAELIWVDRGGAGGARVGAAAVGAARGRRWRSSGPTLLGVELASHAAAGGARRRLPPGPRSQEREDDVCEHRRPAGRGSRPSRTWRGDADATVPLDRLLSWPPSCSCSGWSACWCAATSSSC